MKKIISILIILSISLLTLILPSSSAPNDTVTEMTQEEVQKEIENLDSYLKDCETEIENLKKNKASKYKIINTLNLQVNELNNKIETVNEQQSLVNSKITEIKTENETIASKIKQLDTQITDLEKEINTLVLEICDRMRAQYISGRTFRLELLSKSDVPSFLNKLEILRRIDKKEKAVLQLYTAKANHIEKAKKELNAEKTALANSEKTLKEKEDKLLVYEKCLEDVKYQIIKKSNEVNASLVDSQTKKVSISSSKYNEELILTENDLQEFLKSHNDTNSLKDSNWTWPVPYESSYISSSYGYRSDPITGEYKLHSGIDISMANAYGKNIIAAKDGVVSKVVHSNSGYGNHIIISHGGGYATLYAHCSSILVSLGDTVSSGQSIARIGSSGYSTGAHVHFEIRYNGEKQNPLKYVSR